MAPMFHFLRPHTAAVRSLQRHLAAHAGAGTRFLQTCEQYCWHSAHAAPALGSCLHSIPSGRHAMHATAATRALAWSETRWPSVCTRLSA